MDLTAVLSAEHFSEITLDSAVGEDVALARGYRTLTGTQAERQELEDLGFKPYVWNRDDAYPMLLVPMHGADGTVRGHQVKPAVPRMRPRQDKAPAPIKYESPSKAPLVVDVPEYTRTAMHEPGRSLWITEGMKKTDALVTQGQAAIGLTGVFNWRNQHGTLGDWEEIPLKGRPVVLCFDADAAGNRNVQLAMTRLGAWLRTRGVTTVHYVIVPASVNGTETKGVDDYFAAGGDMDGLVAVATQTAPGAGEKDAAFTDAFLVEELAEALQGQFCWASGLGWLRWSGRIWRDVPDVEPLEAVRVWASDQFDKVLTQQRQEPSKNLSSVIAGWRAVLGKSRLTALRDLAKGLLQRDAAEFDGDPDLLTCLNGTLHLPSGKLLPFDPEHCITKQADADYRRGYTHSSWTRILRAVPSDLHEWYQDRLGQALTGYPTPDHTLVIAHGTGSNGKSAAVSVIRRTMGGYGVMVSDRVLMANPDAHPTELMDLRGARYAVMEETPEARQLNVQRLKTTLGTESIKARHIRQDTVEFLTSHSLFINTNYKPTVVETDWGTWRRLSLMTFPYTFRKPGAPLESPWDRTGDPKLAYASNDPEVRAAALAWMAEGAQEWYRRGRMMLPHPERVEKETRSWRAEMDLILGFSDECLRFDREAFTQTQEMLQAFNEWAGERGHRPWNDRTFASRFGAHDTVRGAKVQQGRFSIKGKQMRGWSGVEIRKDGRDPMTGERDEPPAPELPEWPCSCDPGPEMQHRDYCGQEPDWDASCLADPDGPAGPDRPDPVTLGFDLETASADQLFTGGYEGPFVRLMGTVDDHGNQVLKGGRIPGVPLPDFSGLPIEGLDAADTIYGHNVLGFDLLALAHHHGADYDALAAKAVDTLVLARLIDPPLSKGMPNGYYSLDEVAHRLGHAGKTDDLKALAKRHGGFDRIPLDSREYQDYLRGDLAATKAVYEKFSADMIGANWSDLTDYAKREMRVVALQNRMTLNGWATDQDLLSRRVAEEDAKRAEAVAELHERYGVPLAKPDRFKLLPKADWPEQYAGLKIAEARAWLLGDAEEAVRLGLAVRIPGETFKSPWASAPGREAIEEAFRAAGAPHVPRTGKGALALSADALGEGTWYCPERKRPIKGMLHKDCYGHLDSVRALCEVLGHATGARVKYAEIAQHVTAQGRVHAWVGAAQGSGRWAMTKPSITNMGSRGAAAEERAVLVADEGHLLLTVDASQVDMRAMAGLSQDPAYMKLFEPGRDAHSEMSVVYFGDASPVNRQRTKAINHKLNYGGGAQSTADMNGIPLEVVQHAMDVRAETYPRLVEYIEEVRAAAERGELLDNGFGRLMRADPERAWTQGPALMGQGCARDICTTSLLRLVDARPDVTPFLRGFVHDELILSVPADTVEEWAQELRRAFTWEWRGVPILCEVGTPAFRWSDCK